MKLFTIPIILVLLLFAPLIQPHSNKARSCDCIPCCCSDRADSAETQCLNETNDPNACGEVWTFVYCGCMNNYGQNCE